MLNIKHLSFSGTKQFIRSYFWTIQLSAKYIQILICSGHDGYDILTRGDKNRVQLSTREKWKDINTGHSNYNFRVILFLRMPEQKNSHVLLKVVILNTLTDLQHETIILQLQIAERLYNNYQQFTTALQQLTTYLQHLYSSS